MLNLLWADNYIGQLKKEKNITSEPRLQVFVLKVHGRHKWYVIDGDDLFWGREGCGAEREGTRC